MLALAQKQTICQMRTDAVRCMTEIDVTDKSEAFGRSTSTLEKISIKNTKQSKTGMITIASCRSDKDHYF